ncbi:hypothetical protein [Duganella sp. Dugasp56]|uniref:hypothetical protein n=1 Tax=Duganella sp. Dugasp56 TaxID=3243046 RepID=UPI0039AF1E89
MARILFVSHTPRGFGFGKVAAGIADALASRHVVRVLGLGPAMQPEGWTGESCDPLDIGCSSALRAALRTDGADLVLLVGVNVLSAWQASNLQSQK